MAYDVQIDCDVSKGQFCLSFCCRSDGGTEKPLMLPTTQPFYLLQVRGIKTTFGGVGTMFCLAVYNVNNCLIYLLPSYQKRKAISNSKKKWHQFIAITFPKPVQIVFKMYKGKGYLGVWGFNILGSIFKEI